jgi:hypothetical protein
LSYPLFTNNDNYQSAHRSSYFLCAACLKATSTILLKVCFKSTY